jgi:hypothetical protein
MNFSIEEVRLVDSKNGQRFQLIKRLSEITGHRARKEGQNIFTTVYLQDNLFKIESLLSIRAQAISNPDTRLGFSMMLRLATGTLLAPNPQVLDDLHRDLLNNVYCY